MLTTANQQTNTRKKNLQTSVGRRLIVASPPFRETFDWLKWVRLLCQLLSAVQLNWKLRKLNDFTISHRSPHSSLLWIIQCIDSCDSSVSWYHRTFVIIVIIIIIVDRLSDAESWSWSRRRRMIFKIWNYRKSTRWKLKFMQSIRRWLKRIC